jgi:hypothetical protein
VVNRDACGQPTTGRTAPAPTIRAEFASMAATVFVADVGHIG